MARSVRMVLAFLLGVLIVAPPAAGIDSEPGPDCATDWIAAAREVPAGPDGLSTIEDARAGQQECYDRFVVDMSGTSPRVIVSYVAQVQQLGSGFVVPLRGDADLLVQVFAAAHDQDFNPTYDPPDRHEAVDVTGFEAFRQVYFDGTFEGESFFALGLRERLPFRVLTLDGPGEGSRIVVDVAHSWAGTGPSGASPLGNFETASGGSGVVEVKGWMLDPDTTDPIYPWVTIDGVGRHLYANANRPDVAAAFPGYRPAHGFRGTIPASAGQHTVCVTATNVGPGAHTPLGCRTVTVSNASPFGNFERASGVLAGIAIKGWMADPSDPTRWIYAWVTVDGSGRHLFADKNRPDVAAALPGYGPKHGFEGTIPASPGRHTVCVTAANIGPGSHTPLGCRVVTVPNPSPFGNYEGARGVFGEGVEVKGWMADPDTPMSPIFGWVSVDGAGQHILADDNRPDVGAVFPAYGPNHGYRDTLPAGPGRHWVCVTGSNVGAGSHTPFGCRTVGVFEQPAVWPAAHVQFATPQAAAADFVTKALGVPASLSGFRQGDSRSGEIDVLFAEGGSTVRGTLFVRQLAGDAWFVLGGVSDGVTITAPAALAEVPAGPVTVEGLGRGFEGTVVVQAFLAGSTTLLDEEITIAGSTGTAEPYSVVLDLSAAMPGDVVTILAQGGVGHENDPGEFSSIPVVITG